MYLVVAHKAMRHGSQVAHNCAANCHWCDARWVSYKAQLEADATL